MRRSAVIGLVALLGMLPNLSASQERRDSLYITDLRTDQKVEITYLELSRYELWVKPTIEESRRRNSYMILVEKSRRELHLYKKGERIKSFPIALSWTDPISKKLYENDRRTPEGYYKIDVKKPKSRFYRALRLDYPTKADSLNFRWAKERGLVPKHTNGPGPKDIEIHGEECKGMGVDWDWTKGCIGLSNKDIRELYPLVKVGTPVVIVKYYPTNTKF